jgi:hypothetical protein
MLPPRRRRLTYQEFQQYNPSRSPRWRYERVRQLVDNRPRPLPPVRNRDDAWIREARRFFLEFNSVNRQIRGEHDLDFRRRRLWRDSPDIYFAYDIAANDQQERCRCEVEARILARQDDEEIAKYVGFGPGVIAWYESLFFNVRDKLQHKAYVTSQILFPGMMTDSLSQMSLNGTAKFFGYFAGDPVLSVVIDLYDANLAIPKDGEVTTEFFDDFERLSLGRKSASASRCFEVNQYNVMRLFELNAKIREVMQRGVDAKESLSDIEAKVNAFFAAIPWATSERRDEMLKDSPIAGYIGKTSAEPRAHEFYDIVSGNVSAELESLRDREFPHIQE